MGTLGAVGDPLTSPGELRALIAAVRARTDRPFGVNFITPLASEEHIDACIDERVAVVSFHVGDPPDLFIGRLRDAGIATWMQVGSVALARAAVRAGVDAVIAQGSEAGGSNRSVTTAFTLIPAVVDAVAPVPVLAAGGIADGRGVAAALTLGAEAVWVGTALIASEEADAHEEYKRRVIAACDGDTVITTLFSGRERLRRPVRALRNRVVREWAGREAHVPPPLDPPRQVGTAVRSGRAVPIHEFSTHLPTRGTEGDLDEMCLLAGESAALVRRLAPAREIVRAMIAEAEEIITGRLRTLASPPEHRIPLTGRSEP
jgi:NAD(P)H-dependent flavin oxidoreductase YrpB (nitropropane dioxygenase family)